MRMRHKNGKASKQYCGASICPDMNSNAYMNVNATSGSVHGPIGANANANPIEVAMNFDVPDQIWGKKDIPPSHSHSLTTYRVYGILA